MNALQKATLMLSLLFIPLSLLFMHGMQYRGVITIGAAAVFASAALTYALRTKRAPKAGKTAEPR